MEERERMVEDWFSRARELLRPRAEPDDIALVLGGGGARAAFQAGVLSYIGDAFPEARFSILSGVSAGAINAAHLANHTSSLDETTDRLVAAWEALATDKVYEAESGLSLLWGILRGRGEPPPEEEVDVSEVFALLDTAPLRAFLEERLCAQEGELRGVDANLRQGRLKAFSVTTTSYATGQTVIFVQGDGVELWERPNRVSVHTTLTVDHVMASTALPLIFPAVRIGDAWYGDGGVRLSAPLAPAIHLGADRMLVISTRYPRSRAEADQPAVQGYPPVAQVISLLLNAIFLDVLEQDARMMQRINDLVRAVPRRKRQDLRPIRLLEIRPSVDIGRLSHEYETTLPGTLRLLSRGLGSTRTQSPDWLSLLLFEKEYLTRLIEIGYHDARRQHGDIAAFLEA